MSDHDLIRRGDARDILSEEGWLGRSLERITALPAVTVGVEQIVFDQLNATVGEVGLEMVQDAEDAEFTGERPDLYDYVVSIPYDHATAILAALEPVTQPAPDANSLADLAARQRRLPANTEAVIFDNIEELYEGADQPAPAAMTPEMRALVDEVKFIRDTILKNTRDADGPHTITMPDGTVHTGPLVDLWHNINALIVRRLTDRLDALRAGGVA